MIKLFRIGGNGGSSEEIKFVLNPITAAATVSKKQISSQATVSKKQITGTGSIKC